MAIQNSNSVSNSGGQVSQKISGGGKMTNLVLLAAVIGLAVFGGLFNFQKGQIITNTTELEKQTADLNLEIETYRDNKVAVSKLATDALKQIEADEVRWSEVIAEAKKLIPTDASGDPKVKILSYSGSGSGRVVLNVVTEPTSLPAFNDVAGLIASFNNSVFFRDVYVPSIAKGQTESGETTLSFILNMDYEKPETGSQELNLDNSIDTSDVVRIPVNGDSAPKVPRNN